VSGASYFDLVADRVCEPAGMQETEFLRSDQLPGRAALGYLPEDAGWRTNVLHLPVRGVGDGGAYSTLADIEVFWRALLAGEILPRAVVDEMLRPHHDAEHLRYGLGFWLRADRPTVMLEGFDAGVSFRSAYDPERAFQYTVISNTAPGAWPLVRSLDERLPDLASGRSGSA
jgi:CubicO group peptidase (beta-lactamase class C family)